MKPDMYLITKKFPYGHGEDSFVKPEYPYLCEKFHVKVIAAIIKDKRCIAKRIYRALMFGTAAEIFYRRLKKKIGLNKDTKASINEGIGSFSILAMVRN